MTTLLKVSLRRAVTQDAELDWDAVYLEYVGRVFNFFRYRLGDDAAAEDLTAATFERAWNARDRYRQDLGSFSTWLFTIARRLAINYAHQQRPTVALEEVPELVAPQSVHELVAQQMDFRRLEELLAALPARERELVALKYGAEMTNRMIARLTGLSESNVGTILHRTVQTLRAEWEKEP